MKTNKFFQCFLMVLVALQLMGCGAVQVAMPVDQTLTGLKSAVSGAPGTFLYAKEGMEYFVLGWPQGSSYAFVLVDKAGQVLNDLRKVCATKCDWLTAADYVSWLEKNGWTNAPISLLPAKLATEIQTLAFLVSIGSRSLPTIFMVPMTFPPDPLDLLSPKVSS